MDKTEVSRFYDIRGDRSLLSKKNTHSSDVYPVFLKAPYVFIEEFIETIKRNNISEKNLLKNSNKLKENTDV